MNNNFLDISIYQIQLFLTVARERNFSRAAEQLHLSQPALSKRISYIEDTLGVKLFLREQRPIALTPEGKILNQKWEILLQEFEKSIEEMLHQPQVPEKQLNVCLIDSSSTIIMPVLETGCQMGAEGGEFEFRWEYVRYPEFREKLSSGESDLAFVALMATDGLGSDFEWRALNSFPKVVCMLKTNPLSQKEQITVSDLRDQRFVILSPTELPSHYQLVKHYCNACSFEPKIARYAPNANSLVSSLRKNDEVLICDRYLRGVNYKHMTLFELPEIESGLVAVWKKNNNNPWIRPYLDQLCANFAAQQEGN